MKRRGLLLSVALLMTAPTLAAAQDIVRIATEGAYPPFNFMDTNGKPAGFDVDIANALCAENGWTCEIIVQDWDGIIPGLIANKYDLIIASMGITPQRAEVVAFSDKYASVPFGFVMSEDLAATVEATPGEGIAQLLAALSGKTIGLVAATSSEPYVMDMFADTVTYKTYQKMDDALQDLSSGRIDAYADGVVPITENFLKKDAGKGFTLGGDAFSDPAYFGGGNGIAARKEDSELLAKVNTSLAAILADGTYAEINDRYFDFNVYGE